MPQLKLNFTNLPIPESCLWEQFDRGEQRRTVIEIVARLLRKATARKDQERTND